MNVEFVDPSLGGVEGSQTAVEGKVEIAGKRVPPQPFVRIAAEVGFLAESGQVGHQKMAEPGVKGLSKAFLDPLVWDQEDTCHWPGHISIGGILKSSGNEQTSDHKKGLHHE